MPACSLTMLFCLHCSFEYFTGALNKYIRLVGL
jgi:hypothetical protein